MSKKGKIKIVILAAGKGVRMKSDSPKVLAKVSGKSMIRSLLDSIEQSGIGGKPVIVVGYEKEKVMSELGKRYDYVIQNKQLGTGHAVMSTRKLLFHKSDHVVVLYGDHPLVSKQTITKLVKKHIESGGKITMATAKLRDFKGWRVVFYKNFSRIIRNNQGRIIKDVQFRDATDKERKITEVNPCYFCFEAAWLWKKLKTLKNNNAQKQYYLTDLIKVAMREKTKVESITIRPVEALGANSKEELDILEKFAVY